MTVASEATNAPSRRVLVVEDDAKMADVIDRYLAGRGFEVERAASGDQALWAVAAGPPDVLVVDIMIPHPDGLEICGRLRRKGWNGPIVVVSARANDADRQAAYRVGADVFLAKPFSLVELGSSLDRLLRPR